MPHDLAVLFDHPSWQEPLFAALARHGVDFVPYDLKSGAFGHDDAPAARLYFNQASPSAYVRGNTRAVSFALALLQALEERGARVLNGARPFALELRPSVAAAFGFDPFERVVDFLLAAVPGSASSAQRESP